MDGIEGMSRDQVADALRREYERCDGLSNRIDSVARPSYKNEAAREVQNETLDALMLEYRSASAKADLLKERLRILSEGEGES
jgi:hypothetical protein